MWSVETIYAGVGFCNLIGWIVGNHIIMKPLKLSGMLKKNTLKEKSSSPWYKTTHGPLREMNEMEGH